MTEVEGAVAVAEPAEKTGGRRGRPRPAETLQRDQQVLDVLKTGGPGTRQDIVDRLAAAGKTVDRNQVYLSLWRLNHVAHSVARTRDGSRHVWSATAEGAAAPAPAPAEPPPAA